MENKPSLFANSLLWGTLTSVVTILYSIILMSWGIMDGVLQNIAYVFMIAGMIMGTIIYRNRSLGGGIKYSTALGSCTLIVLTVAVANGIFTYVHMRLSPELIDTMLLKMEEGMRTQDRSDEEIEMSMKYTSMFMKPGILATFAILIYSIVGFLLALVSAAIVTKELPITETAIDNNVNSSDN